MRFRVTTAGAFYHDERKAQLEALGFTFTRDDVKPFIRPWYKTEDSAVFIDLHSLDDLIAFVTRWGDVILYEDKGHPWHDDCGGCPCMCDHGHLEIYDDYQ